MEDNLKENALESTFSVCSDSLTCVLQVTFSVGSDHISCAELDIIDDNSLEGNQYFTVEITAVGDYATISDSSVSIITIIDNEGNDC